MKKLMYLLSIVLIFSLVLTGCSLLSNISQVPATNQSGITYLTKHTADAPQVIDLLAGQTEKVGEVEVWNDEGFLYVKYIITVPDWCLTETHIHVASELNLIPHTKKGNPIPGKFDYSECHTPCITEYTYEIELDWEPCTELYIAAHAVVVKYGTVCVDFEEYSEYDTVSTVSTLAGDVNFYMTDYSGMTNSLGLLNINVGDTAALLHTADLFPVVAEEQTKDPDHNYMDLSMQNIVGFTVGGTYEDDWVRLDPQKTGAGGKLLTDPPDVTQQYPFWEHAYSNFQAILMDFTQINMPKSVSFAGVDLDWNEVWYILYFDMNNTLIHIAIEGPPSGQSGDGVAFPISYSNPDIDKIVIWGNMNGGTPGKVGFAIDNICLEAVIQEETAWANGKRFVEKGNWATYFTYTVQGEVLIEKVTVYPNATNSYSPVLEVGEHYRLEASGTFTYNSALDWADAEWYLKGGNIVKGDTEGSKPYVLDISIDGYSINRDWGAYSPLHVYTMLFDGTGSTIAFSIYDSASGDNKGSLTVKIYRVCD